jgi:Cu-Zn family superoxide dismutase
MKQKLVSVSAVFALALAFGAEATADTAEAELRSTTDDEVGKVTLAEEDGKVRVSIEAMALPAGFHGFHIHTVGDCSASDFTSAGGHFNPTGVDHGDHAGDLPNLLVMNDGTASMTLDTDRFAVADLFDEDGSAIIIHADPDNHANIPVRYIAPPADDATLATGDAGSRLACGVIEKE